MPNSNYSFPDTEAHQFYELNSPISDVYSLL